MQEFQLTRVALIGARIAAFHPYGFRARNELAMRRVPPLAQGESLTEITTQQWRQMINKELPVWIHNILTDTDFPHREQLLMPLRRFEGELNDSRHDEVVSAVLSAGFRDQNLNPLELPNSIPMRQRCAMLIQIGVWQEAYRRLEHDLGDILVKARPQVADWLDSSIEPSKALID